MDPVSRIIFEREHSQPRLLPWVVLAALLHVGVAAAIFLFGRAASARPAQLPVVSVKLVQPRRPPARRATTSRPQPTAPPLPTPVATAEPEPVPTAAPLMRDASADAMPAPDSAATPAPTAAAAPSTTAGRGVSVGSGADRQVPGIPSDFHFTYYVERMLALIESRWYKPVVSPGTRARLRFRIHRDGRVDRIELEESSGHASFDRAALRALYASNPLPPLPPAYRPQSLTVHLAFSE